MNSIMSQIGGSYLFKEETRKASSVSRGITNPLPIKLNSCSIIYQQLIWFLSQVELSSNVNLILQLNKLYTLSNFQVRKCEDLLLFLTGDWPRWMLFLSFARSNGALKT